MEKAERRRELLAEWGRLLVVPRDSEHISCFSRSSPHLPGAPPPIGQTTQCVHPSIVYTQKSSLTEEVNVCVSFSEAMEKRSTGRNGNRELTRVPQPSSPATETWMFSLWGPQKSHVHTLGSGGGQAETLAGLVCLPAWRTGPRSLDTVSGQFPNPGQQLRSLSSATSWDS